MGVYTVVGDVKSLFRRIKIEDETGNEKTNTVVTTEEVDDFILDTEASVTARLATCYDVTNIGVESKKIIKTIVKYYVADIIKEIMELTVNNSDRKRQDVTGGWAAKADKLLEQVCPEQDPCPDCFTEPTVPLPDTPLLKQNPKGASLFNSSTNTAKFKKNSDNW